MSRAYDTVEPTIIDDTLLNACVYEQGPSGEAGGIAKSEGIDFNEVLHLRLDFKNIIRIDNLWSFTSLTKLQLDNNIIAAITGLDELVNLVWLDLSFNNIAEISGLDRLVKLQDFSLFHNSVMHIENMDSLVELQVLSLGSNSLSNLEEIQYLRRFPNLQALSLAGNTFCDRDYKNYALAYLPTLKYFDYQMIIEDERVNAIEAHRFGIEGTLQKERSEQQDREDEAERMKTSKLHEAAYVDGMFGTVLFESMFSEDQDAARLVQMPEANEIFEDFREKFVLVCEEIAALGLKEYEKRGTESDDFFTCVAEAKEVNKKQAVETIDKFVEFKKKAMQELQMIFDADAQDAKIAGMRDELANLKHELLLLEMQLVDQLEEVNKEFERNMTEMAAGFVEGAQQRFSQCRDLENFHNGKMTELAMQLLDSLVKGEIETDLSEDLRMLFVDKDTITNALNASHDLHALAIDNKISLVCKVYYKYRKQTLLQKYLDHHGCLERRHDFTKDPSRSQKHCFL
ncbi:dynein regulatory complex subunit 3-like isoform X2 [Corticium candelabrum]|uniref:dynein regulatory complex subunit 3-like isoform X2 n=1 Tax=Corticium candelabrum TaxID=121492 RepID=UPI002E3673C6|nr:dynein regulatory complex subunit 3-like isoform X2 [Corticium candelabrum]